MSKENSSGFAGLLTIAFIVLKLTKVIDWSWWWVLSPVLIPIGIVAILYLILLGAWLYRFTPAGKRKRAELQAEIDRRAPKQSKFMQKLEEAMAESEKRKLRIE
jgi:hypothetical protein